MSQKLTYTETSLIDRDCVLLDGECKCTKGMLFDECRYNRRLDNIIDEICEHVRWTADNPEKFDGVVERKNKLLQLCRQLKELREEKDKQDTE